ncbi:glucokinase [Sulfitobacter albidus]|uniref:Glucokinase n=1 Tax=Sulfitobacter albidus TaxID=2829501 RepID=A0A975JDA8_9RHOB|nr:glucokinase [Sulfitobacter albidus]QUJ76379.1 glucokinase [Sulfitobacter albidus]
MARLVADVGGTNTRVALGTAAPRSFRNANWPDLYALLGTFLDGQDAPDEIVIAVAGPVRGTQARLTNRDWRIDSGALCGRFGAPRAHLLNDLAALGHALPGLPPAALHAIDGGTRPTADMQALVVGIGTGFNVSPCIVQAGHVTCPPVEAGHVSLPAGIHAALGIDPAPFPTVESLFSGAGFTRFCRAHLQDPDIDGKRVIAGVADPDLGAVAEHYATLLGHLLRDLSLAYLPRDGLFLAGSVARALMNVASTPCRDALHQPISLEGFAAPPLWTITDDSAALRGCASFQFSPS